MGVWGALEGEIGDMQLFNANGERLAPSALIRSGPVLFANTLKLDAEDSCEELLVIRHKPGGGFVEKHKMVTLKVPSRFKT